MFIHIEGNKLKSTIGKWGNSAAVRIPANVLAQANLGLQQSVNITVSDGAIVIQPRREFDYELETMVSSISTENTHSEADFVEPVGKEIL